MEIIELKQKPIIVISNDLQRQIDYLHRRIGNMEWSGVLFYKVIKGSIKNPKDLIIKATSVYVMDKGTAAYTEYSQSEHLIDAFDTIEGSEDQPMGHIHSH